MDLSLGSYLGNLQIPRIYVGNILYYESTTPSGIYDNASVVYSLRRPDMATVWTNAVLKIRRTSDDATAFVFFDGSAVDDTITLSSLISTTSNTTPDATTLGTWVGASNAYVEQWIGITQDNSVDGNKVASQTTIGAQPQFISVGAILEKNGKPTLTFDGNDSLVVIANSDLDYGNTFTILSVNYNTSATWKGIISTSNTATLRLIMFNDNGATKRILRIIADAQYNALYLVQQNTTNQKLLTGVFDPTNMTAYYNATIQNTTVWSGSTFPYNNDNLVIGQQSTGSGVLVGGVQEIIIMPSDVTADLTTLHADINAYYSIY